MPFDNIVSRGDATATIPEDIAADVIKAATTQSAALSLFRQINMGSKLTTLPVLSALAQAYFVTGDTGLKQTTEMAWNGVLLEAEELAAIVPVPDAVIDDSAINLWEQIQEGLAEAVGQALDAAVFSGTGKPPSWPQAIVPAAIAAGNHNAADSTPEEGGIVNDVAETFDDLEEDGYDVSDIVAARGMRGLLRKARDASGQRLVDVTTEQGLDAPITYVGAGVLPADIRAVAGDFTMAVLGIRQNMTFTMLDQAVITDDTGRVIYNLPQQDMTAMRVVSRAGFAVANPVTRDQPTPAERYPFGVLEAPVAARRLGHSGQVHLGYYAHVIDALEGKSKHADLDALIAAARAELKAPARAASNPGVT